MSLRAGIPRVVLDLALARIGLGGWSGNCNYKGGKVWAERITMLHSRGIERWLEMDGIGLGVEVGGYGGIYK
jgi:hypothetical protein